MTPKDKAKELVHKMYVGFVHDLYSYKAKQCALITVDELIEHLQPSSEFGGEINIYTIEYWQEVKQQILNL